MITRKKPPYEGKLAFPGGFVDYNEDPKDACLRELHEECGIIGTHPQLITVVGDPQRDPRGHTVTIAYQVQVQNNCKITAGDDASHAEFYSIQYLLTNPNLIAFDHFSILQAALKKQP